MAKGRNFKPSTKGKTNYRSKAKNPKAGTKHGDNYEKETEHKFNDVSWYTKNEQMLRDAASYSYNNPLGTTMKYTDYFTSVGNGTSGVEYAIPGLYGMKFVPTIGLSTDSISPANIAAQNIYSYVRYMNSGAKNYDQADLMLYLMAMDSVYSMWNWAKRVYGYCRVYSQYNKYLPSVLATFDSVDIMNVASNLADFRYRLNQIAARISAFCVPAVMPIFIRHSWMCSNIYKDSDTEKAQLYMFSPKGYFVYDETGNPKGGQLVFKDRTSTWSYTAITSALDEMLQAIGYSEDVGVMSGDILKAYGQEKLFKLSPIEADYMVLPVYNEEVLNQIHNSSVVNLRRDDKLNVTQDPDSGYLIWNPDVVTETLVPTNILLNMPWDGVTPANTMVGSRLCALVNSTTKKLLACGSEVVVAREIFTYYRDANTGEIKTYKYAVRGELILDDPQSSMSHDSMMTVIAQMSNFDWHPLAMLGAYDASTTPPTVKLRGWLGDINNYTTIGADALKNLHSTAIMSEFNIPQLGSF